MGQWENVALEAIMLMIWGRKERLLHFACYILAVALWSGSLVLIWGGWNGGPEVHCSWCNRFQNSWAPNCRPHSAQSSIHELSGRVSDWSPRWDTDENTQLSSLSSSSSSFCVLAFWKVDGLSFEQGTSKVGILCSPQGQRDREPGSNSGMSSFQIFFVLAFFVTKSLYHLLLMQNHEPASMPRMHASPECASTFLCIDAGQQLFSLSWHGMCVV